MDGRPPSIYLETVAKFEHLTGIHLTPQPQKELHSPDKWPEDTVQATLPGRERVTERMVKSTIKHSADLPARTWYFRIICLFFLKRVTLTHTSLYNHPDMGQKHRRKRPKSKLMGREAIFIYRLCLSQLEKGHSSPQFSLLCVYMNENEANEHISDSSDDGWFIRLTNNGRVSVVMIPNTDLKKADNLEGKNRPHLLLQREWEDAMLCYFRSKTIQERDNQNPICKKS